MRAILLNFYRIFGYVLGGFLLILVNIQGLVVSEAQSVTHGKQEKRVILALGDSLTAGFGVAQEESFPSRLQVKIDAVSYTHLTLPTILVV